MPRPSAIIAATLTLLAGPVGGLLVVTGAASRAGLPAPPPDAVLTALGVGLACALPVAALTGVLARRRPARRVLPPILFPALGVCLFLGPFANHALTLSGVGVSVTLAVLAILFFMRTDTPDPRRRTCCPTCGGAIRPGDTRCPHCAVALTGG